MKESKITAPHYVNAVLPFCIIVSACYIYFTVIAQDFSPFSDGVKHAFVVFTLQLIGITYFYGRCHFSRFKDFLSDSKNELFTTNNWFELILAYKYRISPFLICILLTISLFSISPYWYGVIMTALILTSIEFLIIYLPIRLKK